MDSFFLDVIANDPRFHQTGVISDIKLLEPETRTRVEAIIEEARRTKGIELMIFETYRSRERQKALFDQKASKLKEVGVHHYGLACDIVKNINGEPSWKGDFSFLGRLARKHGLVWGGDWGNPGAKPKFFDGAHVQRCSVKKQRALFGGAWYPDAGYDPYKD